MRESRSCAIWIDPPSSGPRCWTAGAPLSHSHKLFVSCHTMHAPGIRTISAVHPITQLWIHLMKSQIRRGLPMLGLAGGRGRGPTGQVLFRSVSASRYLIEVEDVVHAEFARFWPSFELLLIGRRFRSDDEGKKREESRLQLDDVTCSTTCELRDFLHRAPSWLTMTMSRSELRTVVRTTVLPLQPQTK